MSQLSPEYTPQGILGTAQFTGTQCRQNQNSAMEYKMQYNTLAHKENCMQVQMKLIRFNS